MPTNALFPPVHSAFLAPLCVGRYHYPRCVLHAVETLDARGSRRRICRFYAAPEFALCGLNLPSSGTHATSALNRAHSGSHGVTRSVTLVVALRFISHLTFWQAKAEGSVCTPTACVRFLRRRGPAGLCNTLFNLPICISHALRMGISAHARWKRYHYPRRTPHVVETPGARLSTRPLYRFLTVKQELLFARRLFSCE